MYVDRQASEPPLIHSGLRHLQRELLPGPTTPLPHFTLWCVISFVFNHVFFLTLDGCVVDSGQQVEQSLGPIDVLVNNAGVAVQSPSLKQTKREWEKVRTVTEQNTILGAGNSRFRFCGRGNAYRTTVHHLDNLAPQARRGGGSGLRPSSSSSSNT